jgi:serine/threonine protein kinase
MALTSSLYCTHCGAIIEADGHFCFTGSHTLSTQQAPVPEQLRPQTTFRNRYSIINKIGSGGFGSVYKAIDTHCGDRVVAIKEVSPLGLHPQAAIEATNAFQREVSLLSKLEHPNLPRLYEHFQSPGYWYLVMDFIAGETLEEYQCKASDGRLLLSEVLDIGIQLCTVLDYLHMQQPPIVFRDLKPANIMRTATGQVYLIDFGIARYFKPGPEQYGKAQTTPRADIYSLGAVLHQLLTTKDPSEAPFRFTPLRPNNGSQRHSDPGSLTTSMVEVLVNELEILITSMLAMDVNKRPPDVVGVMQKLDALSKIWSDILKSFWRPRLGYTPQKST